MTVVVGENVWIAKPELNGLLSHLRSTGYEVVGPRVADGAITLGEITSLADLTPGVRDEQEPGKYRLTVIDGGGYFDHVVGPHSLKPFLFPPRTTVLQVLRVRDSRNPHTPSPSRSSEPSSG
ncbi:MAG: hypothetical protein U0792_10545 [Gemmataceae bacterium]